MPFKSHSANNVSDTLLQEQQQFDINIFFFLFTNYELQYSILIWTSPDTAQKVHKNPITDKYAKKAI